MTHRQALLRRAAVRDIAEAVAHYRVTPEQIDVARVLHARRDIASWLLTKE
ncbi:MAG: hypothetical protein IIC18_07065 [Bacteroidetes bacterium]|nr:hypothetical protein [Bacteroidota bacterium]